MPLLYLILWIAAIGFVVWLVTTYIPMPDIFKKVILVVVAIAVVLWVLGMFAPLGGPVIGPGTGLTRHP